MYKVAIAAVIAALAVLTISASLSGVGLPAVGTSLSLQKLPQAQAVNVVDFPQKGEQFAVVYSDDDMRIGIDPTTARQEEDGSRSVVFYARVAPKLQYKIGDVMAVAMGGRIAVTCSSGQFRFLETHILDGQNNSLKVRDATSFVAITSVDDASVVAIANFLCELSFPTGAASK
jgi:hypothetical protein